MSFGFPQALLLLFPLGLALWRFGRVPGPAFALRFALVCLLVVALARPGWRRRGAGSDLVVVVDRSRSMPVGSDAQVEEWLGYLEAQRRPGDRLGVVSFGREPRIDAPLSDHGHWGGFNQAIDAEASDLAAALDAAADLIPADRSGRLLLVSDGKATGEDPGAASRRLAARGLPADFRQLTRADPAVDLAVTALDVPPSVAAREPFSFKGRVRATRATSGTVTLRRGGQVLVHGPYAFQAGDNALTFKDLVEAPGLAAYELQVEAAGDEVPENNLGRAVTRVEGPPAVLVLSAGGRVGTLAQTLTQAGMEVRVRPPFALTLADLEGVRAVVLEDVPAAALTQPGLEVLGQYVKQAGGGLVMTGGHHSFGQGGYRKSAVEEVLPVSMEMRQEQRKAAIAMAVLMDCSCSMGVKISDGRTKMQLAAEGVIAALQMLDERDEASVTMIDTVPHTIFPMSPVNGLLPYDKVASGFSGGGGIYIGVALRDGERKILESHKDTRHVLLFADAADSEEPADYKATVARLREQNVTVSVIGMGTRRDSDAKLLEDLAERGGGRIYFAEDVTSLPRIFSEETIAVARSTFVDGPTPLKVGADAPRLGRVALTGLPTLGGYNLTYLKAETGTALRTGDENDAPVLALWERGAGRAVAFTGEVDGAATGALAGWSGTRGLLEQMVRWTMPVQDTGADQPVVRVLRKGDDLHLTVDFPEGRPPDHAPTLVLLTADAHAPPLELPLKWEEDDRMGLHVSLGRTGTYHPVVKLAGHVLRAPPVTLPYSPEFEPTSAAAGHQVLSATAHATGGVERLAITGLFAATGESWAPFSLSPALVALALALLLAEVAARRFWSPRTVRRPVASAVTPPQPSRTARSPGPALPAKSALEIAAERARKRLNNRGSR